MSKKQNHKKYRSVASNNKIIIAGLDEVGRGPWAGPLVACAFIETNEISGIKIADSKQMNQAEREKAYDLLIKKGIYGVGIVEPQEVDKLGLSKANQLAFKRALSDLDIRPDLVFIDGKDKIEKKNTLNIPFRTLIKGDSLIPEISCASIIAKVIRDRIMDDYAEDYPQYSFDEHKGYGTTKHHQAIKKFGVTKIHRLSYKPVKDTLKKGKKDSKSNRTTGRK